jgi:uncharacterized protein (DUF2141 family)
MFCPLFSYANENNVLEITIEGIKKREGKAVATLFNSEEHYMKKPIQEDEVKINDDSPIIIRFKNLESGHYAVTVYHDKNADGKLNTGFMGIPKEKVGFSNNAKGRMGPAPWSKANFVIDKARTAITIYLGKAKN